MALIEVERLEKHYGEGEERTDALCDISFKIDEGDFIAIMGPSGSGKSTLLHIMGFLDRPSSGIFRFEGKTIDEYSDDELAAIRNKKLGFIFQSFHLLPRTTVLENVKLPLVYSGIKESLWDEKARAAIEAVGLSHRISHDAVHLSGGEKQRVAIARSLVNDPKVVFADEPTGNLDSKSGQAVMEIIQDLNDKKGITVILITHETYTAEHAERIIRIKDGMIDNDSKVSNRHKASEFLK
ncbi:MAG: ABC transporter ATP-binding protein [Candidatus Colwellbacteria bacterium]|nr:ABC transporter ATP-binding protein [Candidatus Colwellbacteria bacterium]